MVHWLCQARGRKLARNIAEQVWMGVACDRCTASIITLRSPPYLEAVFWVAASDMGTGEMSTKKVQSRGFDGIVLPMLQTDNSGAIGVQGDAGGGVVSGLLNLRLSFFLFVPASCTGRSPAAPWQRKCGKSVASSKPKSFQDRL